MTEMAKFCGVSPRALCVYQGAGILEPEFTDQQTGYRAYGVEQSVKLDMPTWDDLGGDADYADNERWEFYQQYTRRMLSQAGYPASLFRSVGCYVEADLVAPDIDLLFSRPFVFVDESFGEAYEGYCLPVRQARG